MRLNQYAVYQLKAEASVRYLRYKSYQYLKENHLRVEAEHYQQVYITTMPKEKKAEEIRSQLEKKLPARFTGNALNISDIIAVTKEGVSTAYYVDKGGLVVIPGFFRSSSSTALLTMDTEGFQMEGRKGSWMAADETIIDGKHFFLLASEKYGRSAAYAVVDDQGRKAAEDTFQGFDEETIRQIRQTISLGHEKPPEISQKPEMEIWQKYYENGEYLRSAEAYGEQNYDMIDGRINNSAKEHTKNRSGKRESVLRRLREKQEEIAARYGKNPPEQAQEDRERNRK